MIAWRSLPCQIRRKILEAFALDAKPEHHDLAKCATVCGDWQIFFEQLNFRVLRLRRRNLQAFERIVQGSRRGWLKRLSFCIELGYSNRSCEEADELAARRSNYVAFTDALSRLFWELSFWTLEDSTSLELELSVRSVGQTPTVCSYGSKLHLDFGEGPGGTTVRHFELPEIEVVTSLSILRQTYHSISLRLMLALSSRLPRLSELHLEDQFDQHQHCDGDLDLAKLLLKLPSSLRILRIVRPPIDNKYDTFGRTSAILGRSLAWLSTRLEELSLSFCTDAQDFFEPFPRPAGPVHDFSWSFLRSLTLTCLLFKPSTDRITINHLLNAAGMAAMRMPKLQMMEIYNQSPSANEAGGFHYLVTRESAVATWRSSWEVRLSPIMQNTWKEVALKHSCYNFRFIVEVSKSLSLPVGCGLLRALDKDDLGNAIQFQSLRQSNGFWQAFSRVGTRIGNLWEWAFGRMNHGDRLGE